MKSAFEKSSIDFDDMKVGLCEEPEFSKHLNPSFVNGSTGGGSAHYCLLRSMFNSNNIAVLDDGNAGYISYNEEQTGFAPACTIG